MPASSGGQLDDSAFEVGMVADTAGICQPEPRQWSALLCAGRLTAVAGHCRADPDRGDAARVLIPTVSPTRPRRPPDRRPPGGCPLLLAPLLVALVWTQLRADRQPPRPPGFGIRPAWRVQCLNRLVPGRRRRDRTIRSGAPDTARRPRRGTDNGSVARTRPIVPTGLVRPPRRLLHQRPVAVRRRRRPLRAARVPPRLRSRPPRSCRHIAFHLTAQHRDVRPATDRTCRRYLNGHADERTARKFTERAIPEMVQRVRRVAT